MSKKIDEQNHIENRVVLYLFIVAETWISPKGMIISLKERFEEEKKWF